MASLTTRLTDLTTRIATEFKSLRTLVNGNASTNAALKTTAKGNLVAAINEIFDKAAGAGSGDMQKATYDTNGDGIVDRRRRPLRRTPRRGPALRASPPASRPAPSTPR